MAPMSTKGDRDMKALINTLCLGIVAGTSSAQLAQSSPTATSEGELNRVLFISDGAHKGVSIPGIAGSLQLNPNSLIAVPRFEGFGPQLVPFLKHLPRRQFDYQMLEGRPGLRLTPRVRLGLESGFRQVDDAATCRERAQRTIDEHRGSDMAPGWAQAQLVVAPRPMYRPDVSGIAYYEFAVKPAGFIVVATGGHDYPVPHWNFKGRPLSAELEAMTGKRAVHKIYKLDTLCYVAEDATGKKLANLGGIPSKLEADGQGGYRQSDWQSWQDLKRGYTRSYLALIANLQQDALDAWADEAMRRRNPYQPMGWSAWKSHWAGSSSDQRLYDQYQFGRCMTGCGATAWALLFGWVDVQAARGSSKWRRHAGIYRRFGTRSGPVSTVAPRRLDEGARNMIQQIRSHIRTFCIFNNGATFPWRMGDAKQYLSGRCTAKLYTNYSRVGIRWDNLRDKARNHIVHYKTPAVIGTGWLKHYPLAWGYKSRRRTYGWGWASYTRYQRKFYVNQGWGGRGNGWVDAKTWFAGRIYA